ncbi:hypothetical protein CPB85DRAFT_197297 [Mucidula mucida]|nr:hypothetical protein CPB85DRAFT_197297 [Mucidula mucida]
MSASTGIALLNRVTAFGGCLRAVAGVDRENSGLNRARMSLLVCRFCFRTSKTDTRPVMRHSMVTKHEYWHSRCGV